MGRKSLALKIYEDCEDIEEEPGTWLVLYDFKGIKPNSKFWDNLHRIKNLAGYVSSRVSICMRKWSFSEYGFVSRF